jgi:hypothetical protein
MARLWQCGFELNSTSTGMEFTTSSGTISLQTGTVRTGTYALRANPTASTGFVRWHAFATDQAIVGYQRFYLNIASQPTAASTICRFLDVSNNSTGAIRLSTAGKLQLLTAGGAQIGSDSAALSTGTWYMVELKTDATGAGALDARLDGSSFASGANGAQGNWSRVLIGVIGTNTTTDLYFDDWALNDASGSSQTSWPGAGKILHLVPNGDGDNHAWGNTANGAGASTNSTLVDEVPPNDATDLVQSGTLNAEDMYALTDSGIGASDTVNVAMVGVRIRNNSADATTAAKVQIKKTTGGTIAQGSAIVPNTTSFFTNGGVEPRNYTLVTYADPDGNPWTQATLDTAQAGVKLTAAGTNRIQVSAVWVSVDYTPSSSTPISASDTGTGTDATSLATDLSSTETGTGTEATSLAATVTATETGSGAEASSLTTALTTADTGTSAETEAISITVTETAAGTDTATLATAITATETGSGADSPQIGVTSADTAAGADAAALAAAIADAETGTSADTALLTAALATSESGAGTDTAALAVALANADTGTGADQTTSRTLTTADTAAAGDNASADDGSGSNQSVSTSDTASGADTATQTAAITATDTGTALDQAVVAVSVTASDSATATDSAALLAGVTAADVVSAAEAIAISAALATSDTGQATDLGVSDDGQEPNPLPVLVAVVTVPPGPEALITPADGLTAIITT